METTPQGQPPFQATQQPVQAAEPSIGDVARGFLSELDSNSDPDQIRQEEPQEDVPPDSEAQPDPNQEAETPPPESEIPAFEYELEDGEKLKVPEKLKPHLMRDKDYRQKTMVIAETKKQLEQLTATAQQLATQAHQMAPYHAQLHSMDTRANQLYTALSSGQLSDDPIAYNNAQGELAIVLRNRDQLAGNLSQQSDFIKSQHTELRAKQFALEVPKLLEQFPDLGKPENVGELAKYAKAEGFTALELEHINHSVAGVRNLWKARQYDVMVRDQAAHKASLAQKVKTLPPATQSSRASDKGANTQQLQKDWQKGGGKFTDPALSALLRAKLRGK